MSVQDPNATAILVGSAGQPRGPPAGSNRG